MNIKIKPPLAALTALLAAGSLVAVAAAGCGSDDTSSKSSSGNTVDAAFVTDMIPHHQGAIDMAEIAQERARHPQLRSLASRIIAAQKAEIAVMRRMQGDLDHMGFGASHMGMSQHDMGMDGDMPLLERSNPFDEAFIDMMIPHHQGAIRMARQQLADGRLPALHTMAKNIIAAQTAEIAQMRAWRKQWYGSSSGRSTSGTSMMDDH